MALILIIETVPRCKNPIDAHVRNALAIKIELEKKRHIVDLLFVGENSQRFQKKYDIIFVSYATQYPFLHEMDKIEEANIDTPWGWITNEYNLRPNAFAYTIFKRRRAFLLCNYALGAVKFACFDSAHSINLNLLLFKMLPVSKKTHNLIYYGTYRKDREVYFRKYFNENLFLSTSSKNHKKFLHIGCKSKPIGKIEWHKPLLQAFRYSLYIEDSFTHSHFNNLANRFYESLASQCVLLFDFSCINTLKTAGIDNYEPFILKTSDDLLKYDEKNYQELLTIQSQWKNKLTQQRENVVIQIENVIFEEMKNAKNGKIKK